jgi:hypothetical protein
MPFCDELIFAGNILEIKRISKGIVQEIVLEIVQEIVLEIVQENNPCGTDARG